MVWGLGWGVLFLSSQQGGLRLAPTLTFLIVFLCGLCVPSWHSEYAPLLSAFDVNLLDAEGNIMFRFKHWPDVGFVDRNSKYQGDWGTEEGALSRLLPFTADSSEYSRPFEIEIERSSNGFLVTVNDVRKPEFDFTQARPIVDRPRSCGRGCGIGVCVQRWKAAVMGLSASHPDILAFTSNIKSNLTMRETSPTRLATDARSACSSQCHWFCRSHCYQHSAISRYC
jgi:hypothetical protein